jgi:hypothetical protein
MTDDDRGPAPRGGAPDHEDDSIAPHLVRPLRAAERADGTFTARVMSAVHAEARGREHGTAHRAPSAGWWQRKRTIQLSPLGGLGIAAGIVGLFMLGMTASGGRSAVRPDGHATLVQSAAPETVHVVRFVFTDPEARAVSLVGSFNGWSKDATPLEVEREEGTWVATVELPRGRHEYAFVVRRGDGELWAADPLSPPVRDDFGTESSVVTVGSARPTAENPSAS